MKKYFLLLTVLLSLFSIGYAADQGISVNSPYLVTHWKCGNNLNIQWNKWGNWTQLNQIPGNQKVRILLRKVENSSLIVHKVLPRVIADNVPSTSVVNSFNWRITGNTKNGEYHVIVQTINKQFKGESEIFYIEGCNQLILK